MVSSWPDQLLASRSVLFGRLARQQVLDSQNARLARLISHAYANVPYYRRLFDRHGISPADVRTVSDLRAVPITTKDDLRRTPLQDTLARGLDPRRLAVDRTSGVSGQPFAIWRTHSERRATTAFWLRALRSFGLRTRDRRASVIYCPQSGRRGRTTWRRVLNALGVFPNLCVNCALPTPEIIRMLREYRPDFLTGYAGAITRLAQTVTDDDRRLIRPRVVTLGAEMVTDSRRKAVADAFGTPIYSLYGSNEFSLIAWECTVTGEMHNCDDALVLEVLRDGEPVAPGEQGELVGTSLHSFAMPFIRYRLGDIVTRGSETCACGLPFSTIRHIEGRTTDYLRLPGGRSVHPLLVLGPVFEVAGWIDRMQFVQEREDRIDLHVVPLSAPTPDELRRVEEVARGALGPEVRFSLTLVTEISPSPRGKSRTVRSIIAPTGGDEPDAPAP